MLRKDDKNQQLVYYQVRHYDSRFWDNIMSHLHCSVGWHRDIYRSRYRNTTCGKMEKDRRYGHRQPPRCPRYG